MAKASVVPYASEVAKVGRRAILPEQGVVLNRDAALTREADGLSLVVNRHGLSVRVASWTLPFVQMTGSAWKTGGSQVASGVVFSAAPPTWPGPRQAAPLFTPKVGKRRHEGLRGAHLAWRRKFCHWIRSARRSFGRVAGSGDAGACHVNAGESWQKRKGRGSLLA